MSRYESPAIRLMARLNKNGPVPAQCAHLGPCWLWTAHVAWNGYGRIMANGKNTAAHRLSYEIHRGPIPDGARVLHECDTPRCCNPLHLRLGTPLDNARDRNARGRHGHPSRAAPSTMTKNKADEIRSLYSAGGVTQQQLAARFDIDQTNVSLIVRGKAWR